ncbi:MAG: rod shape-determining protein MreC, partial [Thermodesulfovibrionales bacterium]
LTRTLYALNTYSDALYSLLSEPVRSIRAALADNAFLTREVRRLKLELNDYNEIKAENERLRGILVLKERQTTFVATARVISRGADQSVKSYVVDKGTSDGIEKDMVVIVADGLVGKVLRTWQDLAEIIVINDSSFSVSVRLGQSRVEGVLTGNGRNCQLNYVSNEVPVSKGDELITSGLDRLFPPGIPVGTVSAVQKTSPELFQNIYVEPHVNTARLEEVMIIHQ